MQWAIKMEKVRLSGALRRRRLCRGVVATGLGCAIFAGDAVAVAESPTSVTTDVPEDVPEIIGGDAAQSCQWPSTVAMGDPWACTGTLVHPEIVLYASHCPSVSNVSFGEAVDEPARTVPVDHCAKYDPLGFHPSSTDYAYCKLATPVTDIPITPVAYGCEVEKIQVGTPVVLAGFGGDEWGVSGVKRFVVTPVVDGSGTTPLIVIGSDGNGGWYGDSGGPAFVQMDDGSWRAFGITSGALEEPIAGGPGVWVNMAYTVAWVESESGVDITPCFDQDGSWNPTPECGGFAMDPTTVASWADACEGQQVSGYAQTCGDGWDILNDEVAPVITITTPVDGDDFFGEPALIDVNLEATDDLSGVARLWLSINGEAQAPVEAVAPYVIEQVPVPAGEHTLVAFAEDFAGNVGVSPAIAFAVAAGEDDGGTGGDGGSGGDGASGCGCDVEELPAGSGAAALLMLVLGSGAARRRRHP